eukprot:scaffold25276_cov72-Phaeocystis_antarctica.AAC.3
MALLLRQQSPAPTGAKAAVGAPASGSSMFGAGGREATLVERDVATPTAREKKFEEFDFIPRASGKGHAVPRPSAKCLPAVAVPCPCPRKQLQQHGRGAARAAHRRAVHGARRAHQRELRPDQARLSQARQAAAP